MKAWKKAHSEGVNSEFMKDILKRVFDCKMKQLKKEEVTGPKASKGFQQQKAKKSAFQKKMDKAYGGEGHPPKPKSMYDCFKVKYVGKLHITKTNYRMSSSKLVSSMT